MCCLIYLKLAVVNKHHLSLLTSILIAVYFFLEAGYRVRQTNLVLNIIVKNEQFV